MPNYLPILQFFKTESTTLPEVGKELYIESINATNEIATVGFKAPKVSVAGQATLINGSVEVPYNIDQATQMVIVSYESINGTPGVLYCSEADYAIPGSFIIKSTSINDNSTVNYLVVLKTIVEKLATPVIALNSKTDTTADLSIGAIPNATNYIWYNNDIQIQSSSSVTLNLTGLTAATNYTITCKAQATGYTDSDLGQYSLQTNGSNPSDINNVTLQIQMSNADNATVTIPLLKYNKQKIITFDYDDNNISSLSNHTNKLSTTYYTDGCNNNIPFTAGVFLNIRSWWDNAELPALDTETAHARGSITYDEGKQLILAGWDIGNHGYYHVDGGEVIEATGETFTDQQLVDMDTDAILQNTNYLSNTLVVPTNYAGFTDAAANSNYIASVSQADETADGWPQWDNQWYAVRRISMLQEVNDLFWFKRDFAVSGWNADAGPVADLPDLTNATEPSWLGIGTHAMDTDEENYFYSWIDSIKQQMGDTVMFTSAREFAEYQHLRLNLSKSQTQQQSTINLNVDYTSIPNKDTLSWYDVSFIVSGEGTIQNVTCNDNRFNVSFNAATGLINLKYRRTEWVNNPPVEQEHKLVIDKDRLWVADHADNSPEQMFDGILTNENGGVLGYGLKTKPDVQMFYDFGEDYLQKLTKIRIYTDTGTVPFKVTGITADFTQNILLNINTTGYQQWNEYPFTNATIPHRGFIIQTDGTIPAEIELYGMNEQAPPVQPAAFTNTPLRQKTGVNMFPWTFFDNVNGTFLQSTFDHFKYMGIFREYEDWHWTEALDKKFTYTQTYDGGWDLDIIRQNAKQEGIEFVACLQLQPQWMLDTWPVSNQNIDNVPVRYPLPYADPNSYDDVAQWGFQQAARFGANTNIDDSLLLIDTTKYEWWHRDNLKLKGLNYCKYYEIGNEWDHWWVGGEGLPLEAGGNRTAYMTALEYAACISAAADGHKNTMGTGRGIKNADANAKVVMVGTANTKDDYVNLMLLWFEQNRGKLDNDQLDIPIDVVNFHFYPNNGTQQGEGDIGVCPELANWDNIVAQFHKARVKQPSLELWLTEIGWDDYKKPDGTHSDIYAAPIGSKTSRQVIADWALRTSLMAGRTGIDKITFFQSFDQEDPNSWGTRFSNCGFFEIVDNNVVNKPAANLQTQLATVFGDYVFAETLNSTPHVDKYVNGESVIYALWMPTMTDVTTQYALTGLTVSNVIVYDFSYTNTTPATETLSVTSGSVTLTVTEKPLFVKLN